MAPLQNIKRHILIAFLVAVSFYKKPKKQKKIPSSALLHFFHPNTRNKVWFFCTTSRHVISVRNIVCTRWVSRESQPGSPWLLSPSAYHKSSCCQEECTRTLAASLNNSPSLRLCGSKWHVTNRPRARESSQGLRASCFILRMSNEMEYVERWKKERLRRRPGWRFC